MQAQLVKCPNCDYEFELSESLSLPLVEQVKTDLGAKLQAAQQEAQEAKTQLAKERSDIELEKANIASEVAKGVTAKRAELENTVRGQVTAELQADVDAKDRRIEELIQNLRGARQAELDAQKAKQDAELKAQSVDLEVTKKVNEKLAELRKQALEDAEDASRLKIADMEKKLADTSSKLAEAQRKIEQGSQQLQGEVAEIDLEGVLNNAFPWDTVEPVKAGQRGADVVQRVCQAQGVVSGTIIWERKRAQNWGGEWATKAKRDAGEAKAEVIVIVSEVLPKDIGEFGPFEGVWVCKLPYVVPLAHALRQRLVESATARKAAEGKQTKAGMLYDYVMGPEFASRIKGIAEPFVQMQRDLESERRTMTTRWARRAKQIDQVLEAAFGMGGDIEALTGTELPQLEQVELKALGAPITDGSRSGGASGWSCMCVGRPPPTLGSCTMCGPSDHYSPRARPNPGFVGLLLEQLSGFTSW